MQCQRPFPPKRAPLVLHAINSDARRDTRVWQITHHHGSAKLILACAPPLVNLLLILVSRRAIENNDLTPLLRPSFSAARMLKLITPRANRRGTGQRRMSVKGDARARCFMKRFPRSSSPPAPAAVQHTHTHVPAAQVCLRHPSCPGGHWDLDSSIPS